MDIGPIWRAMLRNKAGFVLIALQVAVTLTIMVNAVGIIQERSGMMDRPSGLALGDEGTFGWATFSGKATYLAPGMSEPEGNHAFTLYVEDLDEPGTGIDRVWLETRDKGDDPIPVMSLDEPAPDNAVSLGGGNIVVPHQGL